MDSPEQAWRSNESTRCLYLFTSAEVSCGYEWRLCGQAEIRQRGSTPLPLVSKLRRIPQVCALLQQTPAV